MTTSDFKIRSFVLRTGRITRSQQQALTQLGARYCLLPQGTLDFQAIYANAAPVHIEIGFGMGDSLLDVAEQNPDNNYLGIEVHTPGVGNLLRGIETRKLTNLRAMSEDAVEILQNQVPDHSLDGVEIFFPDPWHKRKHHKRRLIQAGFVRLLCQKLKISGQIHLATDWQDYARSMLKILDAEPCLRNIAGKACYSPRPDSRPLTKFERRGHRLGHGVWDLIYARETIK